jgi:pyruvate/2-oxoglutarate dehydrogenase complex dihydrolipoamide dehydrogenase (E3) component
LSSPSAPVDVLVLGGGLGGVATALTAARLGLRVLITEETDWLGGQLTAQAVPSDEHPWIETSHVSRSYSDLRSTPGSAMSAGCATSRASEWR